MEITQTELSKTQIDKYQQMQSELVLPDPPDQLRDIYVISNIAEITGLRAERDMSPESLNENPKLGNLNPNFAKFQNLIETYMKKPIRVNFDTVYSWLEDYLAAIAKDDLLNGKLQYYNNYTIDVRHSQNLCDCLSYLITYGVKSSADGDLGNW